MLSCCRTSHLHNPKTGRAHNRLINMALRNKGTASEGCQLTSKGISDEFLTAKGIPTFLLLEPSSLGRSVCKARLALRSDFRACSRLLGLRGASEAVGLLGLLANPDIQDLMLLHLSATIQTLPSSRECLYTMLKRRKALQTMRTIQFEPK